MSDALQQIRCSHSRPEDRLLLEISTGSRSAYRMWLTRRFVKLFWRRLVGTLAGTPEVAAHEVTQAKRAVMAFQKQKAVQASDFSKRYERADLAYPLGEDPLLPTRFTVSPVADGTTRIGFTTAAGVSVAVSLSRDQVYSFSHLLMSAVGKSGWDLNLIIGDDAARTPAEASRLH